jgi:hypothetical protein
MAFLNDVELGNVLVFRVEERVVIPKKLSSDASTDAKEADDIDNAAACEYTLAKIDCADPN